jgi:putative sugar O-methyltransferase
MSEYSYLFKWLASRVRFIPRGYYLLQDRLLYTKSSHIFYKRVATVPYEIDHTRYYNFFGRTLFAIKEVIALLSKEKIFKKSITLEGYESVDYPALYKEGSHEILWPKSPFVELKKNDLNLEFVKALSLAYQASYHDDPQQMDKGDYAKAFEAYYLDKEGILSAEKLADFRADYASIQNMESEKLKVLNLSFILTDHLEVLNKSMGYFKSYLKSLDLILEYHRLANFVDTAILGSVSESFAGNIQTPLYRGQRLSDRLLFLATVMSQLQKHTTFEATTRNVIVDIGGGFGHMGRFTHYYIPNSCYILVELNEMGCFGATFLKQAFPDKKIALYHDIKDRLDRFDEITTEYDFIILPTWAIHLIPNHSVNLYIATSSIAELPETYAKPYIETIDRTLKAGGYFYVNSRVKVEAHTPDVYIHYKWKMKSDFLTCSYQYHPVNRMRETSPQWIGKKIS